MNDDGFLVYIYECVDCHYKKEVIDDNIITEEFSKMPIVYVTDGYVLKENDTFSIRKIGKFKYIGVVKTTKSNNLIVQVLKYI